ncbi:HK97 family phage prohead protease [Paraburkholderia youngii]|uniref:HK97 family phage prohead protease n=1 Tax=Paraburkholderia youngii TaxID=2782701 RepID=UPI003D1B40C2
MDNDTRLVWRELVVKHVDDDARVIEGIASTPDPDRYEDIVEPLGCKYALPISLLWQHRHDEPIGQVESVELSEQNIKFVARIAKILDPGELKNCTDKAWQCVKAGLTRGVSIGFRPIEMERIDGKGFRFKSWDWCELSLVTIPANVQATIEVIRSLDTGLLAAPGDTEKAGHIVRINQPSSRVSDQPYVLRRIVHTAESEHGADC